MKQELRGRSQNIKFGEVQKYGSSDPQTRRQTDRQTNKMSDYQEKLSVSMGCFFSKKLLATFSFFGAKIGDFCHTRVYGHNKRRKHTENKLK